MSRQVAKFEITSKDGKNKTNCLVANGKVITTSFDERAILEIIKNIDNNLSFAGSYHKITDNKDTINNFNWSEMIEGAVNYCSEHVKEFKCMPMDYEFSEIVFGFEEMILMISDEKHSELSIDIASDENS